MLQGTITALITPFKDGRVDEDSLRKLVDRQIDKGVHGLVPCGTTGESATLDHSEHNRVIDIVIEQTDNRVPVIAGAGSNSTWEAIKLTRHAKEAGADAALLITPYYNRPTQEGLYRHYEEVAKAVDIPIIPYNVPGRTGADLSAKTMGRLAKIDNIVGLKDASNKIKQALDTLDACNGDIILLSGDDFSYLSLLAIGGKGGICVMSNLIPGEMAELYNAWIDGEPEEAKRIMLKYHPVSKCLYLDTNPIPVKWGAYKMGLCTDEIRLPLTPLAEEHRPVLEKEMKELGLI
jgi:4-hydroxy-tetrahydrodipicolinate synthase